MIRERSMVPKLANEQWTCKADNSITSTITSPIAVWSLELEPHWLSRRQRHHSSFSRLNKFLPWKILVSYYHLMLFLLTFNFIIVLYDFMSFFSRFYCFFYRLLLQPPNRHNDDTASSVNFLIIFNRILSPSNTPWPR